MKWLKSLGSTLFGSSEKGLVTEVSDAVDRWLPSETSKHKMSLDDVKAGDESQDSARKMVLVSHSGLIDQVVDAMNRLVRPVVTFWIVGGLMGFWDLPRTDYIDPMMMNISWTVITFWFGARMVFKDIPNAWRLAKGFK